MWKYNQFLYCAKSCYGFIVQKTVNIGNTIKRNMEYNRCIQNSLYVPRAFRKKTKYVPHVGSNE